MTSLDNVITTSYPGHSDPRRTIIDITPRLKRFTTADMPGVRLGDHYHAKMQESFYVEHGRLLCKLEDINTKERREYMVEAGQSIRMPLYVAHLVLPGPRSEFLNIIERDFDPADLLSYRLNW